MGRSNFFQWFFLQKTNVFLWIIFLLPCSSLFAIEEIQNLDYKNKQIVSLRNEITQNIKFVKEQERIEITWRAYKIKKDDNFFLIMARTMQNQDTLASVNQLISLWDIDEGQTLFIPNSRGIAVYGKKEELAKKYNLSQDQIFPMPNTKESFYFIPGQLFSPNERNYFNLSIFIRPVDGRVSSPYGMRNDPFTNKKRFHKGIDIATPIGSPVKAAASGKIIVVDERKDYGKYIIVRHANDYLTLYGHLDNFKVKAGNYVKQGQIIATSGNTGRSTGPHLHFEVRKSGKTTLPRFRHN